MTSWSSEALPGHDSLHVWAISSCVQGTLMYIRHRTHTRWYISCTVQSSKMEPLSQRRPTNWQTHPNFIKVQVALRSEVIIWHCTTSMCFVYLPVKRVPAWYWVYVLHYWGQESMQYYSSLMISMHMHSQRYMVNNMHSQQSSHITQQCIDMPTSLLPTAPSWDLYVTQIDTAVSGEIRRNLFGAFLQFCCMMYWLPNYSIRIVSIILQVFSRRERAVRTAPSSAVRTAPSSAVRTAPSSAVCNHPSDYSAFHLLQR